MDNNNNNNWYNASENDSYSYQGGYNSKKKKGVTFGQLIACLLVVALISGAAGAYISRSVNKDGLALFPKKAEQEEAVQAPEPTSAPEKEADPNAAQPSEKLVLGTEKDTENNFSAVVKNSMASVVGIHVGATTTSFMTGETQEQETGSGSGVIITDDGYIVTNNHVVEGAETITVFLQDGTKYEAKLIGKDAFSDLAVIKVEGNDLPAATIASSASVTVGDTVFAVGNPLGVFTSSVSRGIISGLDRTVTIDGISMTLMQTDAAINPGNSGGGLFNSNGELIGIVNAKTASVSVEGLGFAIPVDSARPIVSDLMDLGYVSGRPYIGITMQDVSLRYGRNNDMNDPFNFFGLYNNYNYVTRVQVTSVEEGGAAAKGGMLVNDIITKVDDTEITGSTQFAAKLYEYKVGDSVKITVLRGNDSKELTIVLGEKS